MPTACSDAVHDDLVADAGERTRDAAERLAGGLVADDIDGAAAKGADVVAALHVADGEAAFDAGRPRPRRVGAGIHGDVAFQPEHAAIGVGIADHLAFVVAAGGVADEQLVAILNPAHRTAKPHRRPGDAHGFAFDVSLQAERGADVRHHHAQPALADAEHLRQPDLQRHRQLMRDIDDQLVEPAVVGGETNAAFERQRMHAVHAELALDDMGGGGLRRIQVAGFELDIDQDVVAPFVMNERRHFLQRIRHGHDRRQRLEIDLDQRRNVLGFRARRSKRHRNRLADVAHFADGKDRPIGRLEARQLRRRAHLADAAEVLGDINAVLEPLRLAHRDDAGVGMGAAHEGGVQHARQRDVGAELAAAFEKARVLEPRQSGANAEIACHRAPRRR